MEVCSILASGKLNQFEGCVPRTTAVLLPSKVFKAGWTTRHVNDFWPIPINLASPSPDGQWMAICSDVPGRGLIISGVSTLQG